MLEPERRSQILKFSHLFQFGDEQKYNFVHRMQSHLLRSDDFDKDFILWSEKHWKNLVSAIAIDKDNAFLNWLIHEPQEETSVVVWNQILNLSEHAICRSLDLSSGAFRFRLSRGLCSLGKKL